MIAVDTNLLVYAHRTDASVHAQALAALGRLAGHPGGWAIPWPCAHEFLSVVTGSAFGTARTPLEVALDALRAWLAHPRCTAIGEGPGHPETLGALALRGRAEGGRMHDARIAAICLGHGVDELWTCDRDFARFPDLRTRDPLIPTLQEPIAGSRRAPAGRTPNRR